MTPEEMKIKKLYMINEATHEEKITRTQELIKEWYEKNNGKVYVSFSGGKDSTVLLHLVRSMYPDVEAVFANTGLEYPEIVEFTKNIDNVTILRPKISFKQVLDKYGYPIISKEQSQYIMQYRNAKSPKTKDTRWNGNKWGQGKISEKWKYIVTDHPDIKVSDKCCDIMKKDPFKRYEKESGKVGFIGTMASESSHRRTLYYKNKCNGFDMKRPISKPMSFWNETDIWKYIKDNNIDISTIYSMGYERTGCIWCLYGSHFDKKKNGESRFTRMKRTHPKLYKYCMDKLGLRKVLKAYTGEDFE